MISTMRTSLSAVKVSSWPTQTRNRFTKHLKRSPEEGNSIQLQARNNIDTVPVTILVPMTIGRLMDPARAATIPRETRLWTRTAVEVSKISAAVVTVHQQYNPTNN